MTRPLLIAAMAAAAAATAAPLAGQQPAARTDRIGHVVAIVGDSAILNFDIQDGVLAREAVLQEDIPDSGPEYEKVAQEVLELRINELLIIQAALRDTTIKVLEEQVQQRVEQEIAANQEQIGGAAGLDQALSEAGLTMAAYRERLTAQYRKQSLIDQYRSRVMSTRKPPPVSEEELRELFEERREAFGRRPATVTYEQVSVLTQPSDTALAAARERADSVFALITDGGDFAELARQFTEEPGGVDRAGSLGWFRRSDMVREFADVAFSMQPGSVSGPVLTQFGYHVINVERVRGAEIQASHILLRPTITTEDALRARAIADTVVQQLRAGASVTALAEQYGADDIPVRVGPAELATEEQRLGVQLDDAGSGDVLDPVPIGGEDVAGEFRVVRIVEVEQERDWTLDDAVLRDRLRQEAEATRLMQEIIDDLRSSTYVEIRGF